MLSLFVRMVHAGSPYEMALTGPRFDDSIYRMLGENLLGLTRERDFLLDASSYGARSTSSSRLPGALVDALRFTL